MAPVILIVDDDWDNRAVYRYLLEFHGYTCREAASAEQALAEVRVQRPDLILRDHRLHLPDGSRLGSALAQDAVTASIPLLTITSLALAPEVEDARRDRSSLVLVKPAPLGAVLAAIRTLLEPRPDGGGDPAPHAPGLDGPGGPAGGTDSPPPP